MKRMDISLKQLRTDPRRLVELLNSGYEVSITDHRQTLAVATPTRAQKANAHTVLEAIRGLPPPKKPAVDNDLSFKEIMAKERVKDYEELQRRQKASDASSP